MQLPYFEALETWLVDARDKQGFRIQPWPLIGGGVVLLFLAFVFFPNGVIDALNLALFLSPLWLSALLFTGAWFLWLTLIRSEFIASQPSILLELKPPRSLVKTPLAMETVLSTLNVSKGESNWYQKYVQGKSRAYWSLEIASIEGKIHLYIWTRSEYRRMVESAFYAQYPGMQIVEVPDYTMAINATTKDQEYSIWGCDFKKVNPLDPYPIKTYVDYGLDKVQKEPEQVDPLSNLIEFLGSVGKGEYFWVQIIIRIAGTEKYAGQVNPKTGKAWTWRDEAQKIVAGLRKDYRETYTNAEGREVPAFPVPTKGQTDTIAAIERNVSKQAFDTGIRALYIAKPERFNPIMITGMIALWKQFSSESYNGIKAAHWGLWYSDYPWELNNERQKDKFREALVEAYRRRQYFHEPFPNSDYMIMSTEELATIFHIPSLAVESPALARIQSATAEAPTNLPI